MLEEFGLGFHGSFALMMSSLYSSFVSLFSFHVAQQIGSVRNLVVDEEELKYGPILKTDSFQSKYLLLLYICVLYYYCVGFPFM